MWTHFDKAMVGGIVAAIATILVNFGLDIDVKTQEAITQLVVVGVMVGGAVYATRNKPPGDNT